MITCFGSPFKHVIGTRNKTTRIDDVEFLCPSIPFAVLPVARNTALVIYNRLYVAQTIG